MVRLALASVVLLALVTPSFAQQSEQSGHSQWHHRSGMDNLLRGDRLVRMLPALANGTFFRLKHGDDEIVVYCPANGNAQDCVNAAVDLSKAFANMSGESSSSDNDNDAEQNQNKQ
jgi:hypothetical protein